jgi:hypothetical protein
LVSHIVHDSIIFLIIENIDYTIGYKASHPQIDLQKLITAKITLRTHIYYILILNDTFDLHFCTLILFSVITLDLTTNFLICTELQSGIVSFLFISYNDAITQGPSLSLAPPVSGGNNSRYTASNESH